MKIRTYMLFSIFQGEIRYLADGIYPAPLFFDVNMVSGQITLKQSVLTDSLLSNTYFMKLLAYDTAYPNMFGTATATIFVNRNPNGPQFVNPNCRATIEESTGIGSLIFNSTAVDADGVCIHNSLVFRRIL